VPEPDDHADAFALAVERCEQAFATLARPESPRAKLSRLARGRRAPAPPAEEALLALRDLVDRLATRHRHDAEYTLERLAELERRSLVADDVAQRVDVLEHWPRGAVVDLAHFAEWFTGTDLVLWVGEPDGPVHDAIAGAGPVVIYDASTRRVDQVLGAAVVAQCPVTTDVAGNVVELAAGGLLAVVVDTPETLPAVVAEFERAGFRSTGLSWLADERHGVAGTLVATFRRHPAR
jgi:hypothetical protein